MPLVDQIQPTDIVVLELSSFQLADLNRLQVSPHVAIVTNFAPNHLDWHPDLDDYRSSKQAILRWQSTDDVAVLNDDDPDVSAWTVNGRRLGFGLHDDGTNGVHLHHQEAVVRVAGQEVRWPLRDWLKLPGLHNVCNALAAIAATASLGVDRVAAQTAIENYEPLPHRLELVAEANGRRFYNDSLATTPESTSVALAAFDAPIVLLAGGYDKHVDLGQMARDIAERVKAVALMGQTAETLQQLILGHHQNHCQVSTPQPSFSAAFDWALAQSGPGDVVLLSPGCASYDWFRNFADRGAQFIKLAQSYAAGIYIDGSDNRS